MSQETPPTPSIQPLPSPCVGVCTLRGDYCYGCGRTSDEIAAWGGLSAAAQSAVWSQLPGRLAGFGFRSFRLAASAATVAAFIARSLEETSGQWRIVTPGVEGRARTGCSAIPGAEDASRTGGMTADLHINAHEKVRVFGYQRDPDRAGMDTAVLVLPKGLAAREAEGLPAPGDDAVALAAPDRYSRAWLVGAQGDALEAAGRALAGLDWAATAERLPAALAASGGRLRLANALGRIETPTPVFAQVPADDDANAPADIKVSKAFIAGAIFEADDPEWLAKALAPI